MMTPKEAYQYLIDNNRIGFDEFLGAGPPLRWYFDGDTGILCSCVWRGYPKSFPQFTRPGP